MTKAKTCPLIAVGILSLSALWLVGCTSFNLLNPNFLNQFQPLGQTSLNQVQGKGTVILVLENLTTEARHQENARITVNYIDEAGNFRTAVTDPPLKAVPQNKRNPNNANFDGSFRQIILLDCGVQEIWFTGTVYRTLITTKQATVVQGNLTSQQITYCTAAVNRQPGTLTDNATSMTTITFESLVAPQIFPSHLLQTSHFKCGDVILVGLLDERLENQAIAIQPEACDYVDLNSLSKAYVSTDAAINNANTRLFGDNTTGTFRPLYLFDPTQAALTGSEQFPGEYLYPVGYLLIPIVLPNVAGIDDAMAILEQAAAQNATQ